MELWVWYLLFGFITTIISCLADSLMGNDTKLKEFLLYFVLCLIPVFNLAVLVVCIAMILYILFIERFLKNVDFDRVIIKGRKRE